MIRKNVGTEEIRPHKLCCLTSVGDSAIIKKTTE